MVATQPSRRSPQDRRGCCGATTWALSAKDRVARGGVVVRSGRRASHFSAGAFLGYGDEPTPAVVHVTTTRDVSSRAGVEVHRTLHFDRLD